MQARSTPQRIGPAHLPDQGTDFGRDLGPAATWTRLPAPEGPQARAVPAQHSLRLRTQERIADRGEHAIEADEDQPIRVGQVQPLRSASGEHDELLAQGRILSFEPLVT